MGLYPNFLPLLVSEEFVLRPHLYKRDNLSGCLRSMANKAMYARIPCPEF
jgi:hypothetical protein